MRLFVAVDLDDDLVELLRELQESFRGASGLRFTDPEQAHLTLKFLGEVRSGRVDEVTAALAEAVGDAGVEPFEATFGGLGAFPSEGYIRVVWLGVESGAEAFTRLHEAVEAEMTSLGFSSEDHTFSPHVTLARMDHAGGKELVQRALRERDPTVGSMRVDEVRLKRSVTGPDGPEYTTEARFAL